MSAAVITNEIEYLDLQATELKKPSFLSRIFSLFTDLLKKNWKLVIILIIGNLLAYYLYKKFINKLNS